MNIPNIPQSTSSCNLPVVPAARIPRAIKNAIHFLSAAANGLRHQTNDPQLHRIADELSVLAENLKAAAR